MLSYEPPMCEGLFVRERLSRSEVGVELHLLGGIEATEGPGLGFEPVTSKLIFVGLDIAFELAGACR